MKKYLTTLESLGCINCLTTKCLEIFKATSRDKKQHCTYSKIRQPKRAHYFFSRKNPEMGHGKTSINIYIL